MGRWRTVLGRTTAVAGLGGVSLAGLWWYRSDNYFKGLGMGSGVAPVPALPTRALMIRALKDEVYDVLVLGIHLDTWLPHE